MTPQHDGHRDPQDVDAEFARMLEGEGVVLRPGEAPREPAAPSSDDEDLWSYSADSPPEPPTEESRARARAAHPSAGRPDPTAGLRGAVGPRELDDDEVLYGDFEPPDPDLPQPSTATLWSWTAMIGGFLVLIVVTVVPSMPSLLGWAGGLAAVGGVVALLLRVPQTREDDGNGAEL